MIYYNLKNIYYATCAEWRSGMYLTELSFVIIALTSLNVYTQAKKGYKQGLGRTLTKISVIILCAFLSASVAMFIAEFAEELAVKLLSEAGIYQSIEQNLGSAVSVLIILFDMLFSMVIYLPLFLILRTICDIIVSILFKVLVKEPKKTDQAYFSEDEEEYVKKNKVISATVGAFIGFLISAITFMPFVGAIKTTKRLVGTVDRLAPDLELSQSEIVREIDFYADDVTLSVFYVCGDKLLFDLSTTTRYAGEYTNLNKEIEAINSIEIAELQQILSSLNSMDENAARSLSDLLDRIEESVILREMLLAVVKDSTTAWLNDEAYMGMQRPSFDQHAAINVFMDEIFYVLSTSTKDTIRADLDTIINVAMILHDSQDLFASGDYDAVMRAVVDDGVLNKIKDELGKNKHMRSVLYAVDDIVMSIVADEIKNSIKYTDEECEALFEEFADILTSTAHLKGSARTTAVSNYVKESLDKYGIEVPDELDDSIASILISGIDSGSGSIDFETVEEFFEKYTEDMGKFK